MAAKKKRRRRHSEESRAAAVARVRAGESANAVGKSLGINQNIISRWVKQAGVPVGKHLGRPRLAEPAEPEPITMETALAQVDASLVTLRKVIDAYRKVFG